MSMAYLQVKAFPALVGKTINLPHTEHFVGDEDDKYGLRGSKVTFDSEGLAIVSENVAAALEEFYSHSCVTVGPAPKAALRALAQAQADREQAQDDRHEERQAEQAAFKAANAEAQAATN